MYFIKELVPSEQYKNLLTGYYCDSLPARCLQIVAVNQKSMSYFVYDPQFPQEKLEKLSTLELYDKVLDADIINLPIQKQGSRDVIIASLSCNKIIALKFDDIISNFLRSGEFDLTSLNKDAPSEMHRLGSQIKCIRQKIFASSFMGTLFVLSYDDRKNMISQERIFQVKSMINAVQFDPIKNHVWVLSNDYSPENKKIKVVVKHFTCKPDVKDKVLMSNITVENELPVSMHATCFQVLKSGAILYANKNALIVYYPTQFHSKLLLEIKDEFILGVEEYIDCLLAISDKSIILMQQDEKEVKIVDIYPLLAAKDRIYGYSLTNQNMKNYLTLLTQESINIVELEIDLKQKHFSQKFHFMQRLYTGVIDTIPSSVCLSGDKPAEFQDNELYCLRKVVNEEKSLSNQVFKLSSSLKLANYIEKEVELAKDIKRVWFFEVGSGQGLLIATRIGNVAFGLDVSYGKNKISFEHSKTFEENYVQALKDCKIIDIVEDNGTIFVVTNKAIFEANYKNKSISVIFEPAHEIMLLSSYQENMNGKLIFYLVQKDGMAVLLECNKERQISKKLEHKIDLRVSYVAIFASQGKLFVLQSFFGGKLCVLDLSKKDTAEVLSIQLESIVNRMVVAGNRLLLGTNGKLQILSLNLSEELTQINHITSFDIGTGPVDIVRLDDSYLAWNSQACLIKQDKLSNFSKQKISFKSNLKAYFFSVRGFPWLIVVNDSYLSFKELHLQAEYLHEEIQLPLVKTKSNSMQSQKFPSLQKIFLDATNKKLSAVSDKLLYSISNSQESSYCGDILPLGESQSMNDFENVTFFDTQTIEYKDTAYQVFLIALGSSNGDGSCNLFFATMKPEKLKDITSNQSPAQFEVIGNINDEINFRIIGAKFFKEEKILVLAGRKSILFYTYEPCETNNGLGLQKFKKRIETNARSLVVNIDAIDHYLMVGDSTAGITIYEVKSKSLGENLGFTVELALKYVDLQPCLLNSCIFISNQHALGVDKYGTVYLIDFQEKTFARTIPRCLENELPETGKLRFYKDERITGAIFTGIAGGIYLIYGFNKESISKVVDFQMGLLNEFQEYLNERYRSTVVGEVWGYLEPNKKKQFVFWKIFNRYLEDTIEAKNKLWTSFVNAHEEYTGMSYQEFEKLLNDVLF